MRSEGKLLAGLNSDGDSVSRQHFDLHTKFSSFGDGLKMEAHETVMIFATTHE